MEVLIISGKSGSGKDTFANLVKDELENNNKSCIILHYADLVKYYARQYYNWNGEKDEIGRTLLQTLGTNKVRKVFPNYWAETIAKFLAAIPNDFDCALIPDARFPNEIEIVKHFNPQAKAIHIERVNDDGSLYLNPNLTQEQLNHPSETSLDDYVDFDYIIENYNSDITFLQDAVPTVLIDIGLLS